MCRPWRRSDAHARSRSMRLAERRRSQRPGVVGRTVSIFWLELVDDGLWLPADDTKPNVSRGSAPDCAQIPTARCSKEITRAPLITWPVPVTVLVGRRAPNRLVDTVRTDRLQGQRKPRTGHPPDDLFLIANPRWKRVREHQQSPQSCIMSGAFYLREEGCEGSGARGWVAARPSQHLARARDGRRDRGRRLARLRGGFTTGTGRGRTDQHHGQRHNCRRAMHGPIVLPHLPADKRKIL